LDTDMRRLAARPKMTANTAKETSIPPWPVSEGLTAAVAVPALLSVVRGRRPEAERTFMGNVTTPLAVMGSTAKELGVPMRWCGTKPVAKVTVSAMSVTHVTISGCVAMARAEAPDIGAST